MSQYLKLGKAFCGFRPLSAGGGLAMKRAIEVRERMLSIATGDRGQLPSIGGRSCLYKGLTKGGDYHGQVLWR